MKNYEYSGNSITFEAQEDLESGQGYILNGNTFGIVANDMKKATKDMGELFVTGVFRMKKDSTNILIGQSVYWDTKNSCITGSPGADPKVPEPATRKLVGLAANSADGATMKVSVRLNGVSIQ